MAQRNADRRMWKMSPERLEAHLQLRSRARRVPDKKKQASKKACRRGKWQAFGLSYELIDAPTVGLCGRRGGIRYGL